MYIILEKQDGGKSAINAKYIKRIDEDERFGLRVLLTGRYNTEVQVRGKIQDILDQLGKDHYIREVKNGKESIDFGG